MELLLFIVFILLSLSPRDPNILLSTQFYNTLNLCATHSESKIVAFLYFSCTMECFDNGATFNTSLVSKRTFAAVLEIHTDTGVVT